MGDTRLYPDAKHGLKAKYVAGVLTFSQVDRAPGSPQADPRQGPGIGVRYVFDSYNVTQAATLDNGDMRGMSVVFNARGNLQFFSTAIRGATVVAANTNPRNPRGVTGVLDLSAAGARAQGSGYAVLAQYISQSVMMATGTNSVIQAQLTCTAGAQFQPTQVMSFIRFSLGGDGAAAADFSINGHLLSFQGFTLGAGSVINNTNLTIGAGNPPGNAFIGLRIRVGAATYYIPAIAEAEWN